MLVGDRFYRSFTFLYASRLPCPHIFLTLRLCFTVHIYYTSQLYVGCFLQAQKSILEPHRPPLSPSPLASFEVARGGTCRAGGLSVARAAQHVKAAAHTPCSKAAQLASDVRTLFPSAPPGPTLLPAPRDKQSFCPPKINDTNNSRVMFDGLIHNDHHIYVQINVVFTV